MQTISRRFQNMDDRSVFTLLVVIAIGSLIFSGLSHIINGDVAWWSWADGAFQNFSTEMMGAIVTFWLFEQIVGSRRKREENQAQVAKEKRELVVELMSKDNVTAITALDKLRARGWSQDGSLQKIYLQRGNLQDARFDSANLKASYLEDVNLVKAILHGANLQKAILIRANLYRASLQETALQEADLRFANLKESILTYAELQNADLSEVKLQEANLWNANLRGVRGIETAQFNEKTVLPGPTYDDKGLISYTHWTPDTDMTRYTNPEHPDFWEPDWVKERREQNSAE